MPQSVPQIIDLGGKTMVVTAKLSRKPFIELPVEVYESLSFNLTLRGVNMKNIFIITLLLIFVTAALFAWEAQGVAETLAQKSEQNAPETVEVQITLLKHYLSNYHQHQYTLNNYIRWLHENTLLRNKTESVPVVELTDESIHKATILFMTGKDLAIAIATRDLRQRIQGIRPLTEVEKDALKRYIIEYGGTFFFNYGGGNGSLKYIVREELKDIFNEYEWITVPLEHDIYQTPNNLSGASVAKSKLRGIVIDGRLAVICTEEDLLQKSKTSEEVRQLLVNLLFYALTSTDRFPWVPRENRILQVYVIANFYYERAQKKKEIDDYEGYIQDIEKACESYLKVLELAGYLQEPGGEDRIISEHDPQIAKYLWAIV
ncbi:TPA: DUF4159 domain-containing protein, partial [Candidatus Poribacteria bacterium]|nr:DUF4159 domain-containing protein [Candidatus Poribacteria bacterium]